MPLSELRTFFQRFSQDSSILSPQHLSYLMIDVHRYPEYAWSVRKGAPSALLRNIMIRKGI